MSRKIQTYRWKQLEKVLWCGSKNQPPVSEAHTPWRRICNTCDPMAPPLLRAPSSRDPHGGGPRPMPRLAPEGPGARPKLTPWPPPPGERGRRGESAGRGRGRPGQSEVRGLGATEPHQGRGPGPHPRPRTAPRSRASRQARGTVQALVGGIQRWAWGGWPGGVGDSSPAPARGEPQDPEVHFRGHRSLASVSVLAPLLWEPAQGEGRKKEPRAASLQWRMRPKGSVRTRKRKT